MPEVTARGNVFGTVIPARYVLAILGSIGMAIVYGLKVNLSVALVGMLNHTALAGMSHSEAGSSHETTDNSCDEGSNSTAVVEDGPFIWSEPLQGAILSSYFWGYIVAQLPGGRVAELVSAKWVMFFSVAINVVCTILTPVMANLHYSAMVLMRIGEGIGGGVTFPAMHVMLAHWAPPTERSVMSSIVYAGTALGTVISMLSAGVLAAALGWEAVFYVMGGVCTLWCLLWMWLAQDSPETQPLINIEEREYIMKSLGSGDSSEDSHKKKLPVPWKAVLTSPAFLAILIAHTCNNWGWYMVLIELPFYMKQVLKFNIKENAILTAIPFFSMWVFSMILSKSLDALRARKLITTTTARKTSTLIASIIPGICLVILCYIGCLKWIAVILMAIAITSIGGMFSGFLGNHIDIAPNFAGTLMAITNTCATIPGIIVPIFVGQLTHGNQTIDAWRIIFFVTVALYIIEIFTYAFLGSGEEQSWNKVKSEEPEQQPLHQNPNAYKATEKSDNAQDQQALQS